MSLYLGSSFISDIAITNPVALKEGILRPDAELIQTYSYDKYIVNDEEIDIPEYTTTSTTLKASANLSPTITLDQNNYHYYILERLLTIPSYNVNTKAKGRVEYATTASLYELQDIEPNMFKAILDGTLYTSRVTTIIAQTMNRLLYWSSGTALAAYSSASYGTAQTVTAPSISGTTLTIKSPAFIIRGHTTYFVNTYFNALTDIRYQYIIQVYRAPKGNLNLDGWGITQETAKILQCAASTNHTLI